MLIEENAEQREKDTWQIGGARDVCREDQGTNITQVQWKEEDAGVRQ
jgi:hypothetical protein